MVLYLVGLGLADERDVTVKGLEAIKGSERVYLEAYTSILMVPKERLVRHACPICHMPFLLSLLLNATTTR